MLKLIFHLFLIFLFVFVSDVNASSCAYDNKMLRDNLLKYKDGIKIYLFEREEDYGIYIFLQSKIDGYKLNGASFEIEDKESSQSFTLIPLKIENHENNKLVLFSVGKEHFNESKVMVFYDKCGLVIEIRLNELGREPLSTRVTMGEP